MKAIYCTTFSNDGSSLEVREVPQPVLQSGEVLIEVECCAVHPADTMMVQGSYSRGAKLPFAVGLSGVGQVIGQQRGGLIGRMIVGKRVVFALPDGKFGTWAERVTTLPDLCFPLPDALASEDAVNLLSNAASVIGIEESLRAHGAGGAVISAAGGDLARLLRRHLANKGLPVVCIVRSRAQVERLRGEGEEYVLNSTDQDYVSSLTSLTAKLGIDAAVDTIAGQLPAQLIELLPPHCRIIVVGRLSGAPITIDAMEPLIAKGAVIEGFNVGHWLASKSLIGALLALRKASALLIQVPPPPPQHRFSLAELVDQFSVTLRNTSKGKTLVFPNAI